MRIRCLTSVVLAVAAFAWLGAVAVAQDPGGAQRAALVAVQRLFMASADPDCLTTGAPDETCIQPSSTPANAERGIATFSLGSPGGGGALVIMGREPSGAWGYWFGTQNTVYQRLELPGPMLVCADGEGANIRAEPSADAAVIDTLPDFTEVQAEQFTLTQPGVPPGADQTGSTGAGWYQIIMPGRTPGWVASTLVTDATVDAASSMPPCSIRNLMINVP